VFDISTTEEFLVVGGEIAAGGREKLESNPVDKLLGFACISVDGAGVGKPA
jgi:hypothetical protein